MLVTWDDFNQINKLNKKDAFEQLAHYLFLHLYSIPPWKIKRHSNQAGIEVEPIKVKVEDREIFVSYQAKHFNNRIDWQQCKKSVEVTVEKKREGDYVDLERVDFYTNQNADQDNQKRDKIEKIAGEEGIVICWHYGEEILLELNDPSADDKLKAIAARFFTGVEAGRRIRTPMIDLPLAKVVGRSELAAEVRQALQERQRVQLFGLPGIGKSTLAQYVAASEEAILGATVVNARDLLGTQGGESVEQQVQLLAEKAVSKFVEGRVEGDVLELAKEIFRLDGRLLVIDNLEAPELIRSFVEAVRPARLLLTSRGAVSHELVHSVQVGELSPDAAREQFYNDSKLPENSKSEAVDEICSLLGYLPLAINLLAVQVNSYFDGSAEKALDELREKRLEYLERYEDSSLNPESSMRLSFELSYEHLKPEQKHIFQIMGTLMPSGSNLASIVYMSGLEEFPARRALTELGRRSLIDASKEKYSLHPLLWEYAKEKFEEEGNEEGLKARARQLTQKLFECYKPETRNVDLNLYGYYWKQVLHLTLDERIKLEDFFELADASYHYLTQTSQYWEALNYTDWMLTIIEGSENHYAKAVCLDMQGTILQKLSHYEQATNHHLEALTLAEKYSFRALEGTILSNLGNDCRYRSRYQEALGCYRSSAKIAKEVKNKRGEGIAIGNQAIILRGLGRLEEAYELSAISLFIARMGGYRNSELSALSSFANAVESLFGSNAAIRFNEEALQIAQELGNRGMQTLLLRNIGRAHQVVGDYEQALDYFEQSFEVSVAIDDCLKMIHALGSMGEVWLRLVEPEKALKCHEAALAGAREIGSLEQEGVQLDNLGSAYFSLCRFEESFNCHTEALTLFKRIGYLLGISSATGHIGRIHHYNQNYQDALKFYSRSFDVAVKSQDQEYIGMSLMDLGNLFADSSDYRRAVAFWVAACPIFEHQIQSYLGPLLNRLTKLRKEWQDFEEFLEEISKGTNDSLIETLREAGLLDRIDSKYVKRLIEAE